MIVADKRYVDQKANTIPSPENFRTAVNDSLNFTYASYASWVNWKALQEECSDVCKMYDDNLSGYYDVNKISDDIYIVTEHGEDGDYYIPHIVGKSNPENGFVSYSNYDEALLNGLAIKYSNGTYNTMVDAVKRLLGMMED